MRLTFFFLTLVGLSHFGFAPDSLPYAQTQGCPTVYVTCPDTYEVDKPMTFTANVAGVAPNVKLVYKWEVSAGKIIEGQGTPSIKVDTGGQDGSGLTATVEVEGFGQKCANKASCTTASVYRRTARWFDNYGIYGSKKKRRGSVILPSSCVTNPALRATSWSTQDETITPGRLKPEPNRLEAI